MIIITRKGKLLYFDYDSEYEINAIDELLTFKEKPYNKYGKIKYHKFLKQDDEGRCYTLFGYLNYLKYKLDIIKFDYKIIDETKEENDIRINLESIRKLGEYELRDYQLLAVAKSLQAKYGVVLVATSGGKTLIMSALAKYINKPTLFIVPTIQLAEQLYDKLLDYGFNKKEISVLSGKQKQVKKFNIAVSNTAYNIINKQPELFEDIKVLIYDEFHHKQASTWLAIDKFFENQVEYNIGFTGSVFRYSKEIYKKKSLEDFTMLGMVGEEPIIEIDYKFLLKRGYISTPYFYIESINYPQKNYAKWHDVYKNLIVENDKRNEKISNWISFFYKNNMKVLTLADRIEHIKRIANKLDEDILKKTIVILGNNKGMIWEWGDLRQIYIDYNDIMDKIERNVYTNIIASPVLKEGTDIPSVNAVILAYAGKSEVAVLQKIGRGLRKTEDKDKVFIIDFYDNTHPFIKRHSASRIRIYKEQEFPLYFSVKMQEDEYKKLIKEVSYV